MTQVSPSPPAAPSDELLPPVQPPSASFLVQLFVIPGLIVFLMVLVWLLVNWLPQMGNDAEANVRALEGGGGNRWQAAVNLANLLRSDTDGKLKRDAELAQRLATKLDQELVENRQGEDAVLLRVYLATALGEFYVDNGLPVLVKSIRHEDVNHVKPSLRVAAVRAVAVLSSNFREQNQRAIGDSEAVAAVIDASTSEDSLLRTTAAFALGEMTGEAAENRLRALLDDVAHPYARYNAATALARQGEPAVLDAVLEMLTTTTPPESSQDDTPEERDAQRSRLVIHGLQATSALGIANPQVDLSPAVEIVRRLESDDSMEVRQQAKAVLNRLKRHHSAA
jgi:hypothetical protein